MDPYAIYAPAGGLKRCQEMSRDEVLTKTRPYQRMSLAKTYHGEQINAAG